MRQIVSFNVFLYKLIILQHVIIELCVRLYLELLVVLLALDSYINIANSKDFK